MKNIYATSYRISTFLLFMQAFILFFGVLSDFNPISLIIIGISAMITAVIHGSIGERYEQMKNHIETLQMLKEFNEFLEKMSKEIEGEKSNEEKS